MFFRKLVLSNFVARKTRVALTVAAVALSVSLVVAVTSGYASVQAAVRKFMDQYMGAIDAQVSRQNDPRGAITERAQQALRNDPDVKRADGRVEIETSVLDADDKPLPGRSSQVFGVTRNATKGGDPRLEAMSLEAGKFFESSDGNDAVIDQAFAQRLIKGASALDEAEQRENAATTGGATPPPPPPPPAGEDDGEGPKIDTTKAVGLKFSLPGANKLTFTVVGVVRKPDIIAQQIQTIYVPLRTLQAFQGWDAKHPDGPQVNRLNIELNKGVDPRAWEQRWIPKLQQVDPNLKLKLTRDTRGELDKQMGSIDMLSYLGGTVSMLAAAFIVFSSLSMGVSERQRTLAMLRAVGAFRWQIGTLVVVEGFLLVLAGVAIGVPLGWLWVKFLTLRFHELFTAGVNISWGGVLLGSGGSLLAALLASALPAWWATRVRPLEAMAPESKAPSTSTPWIAAIFGLLLVGIDPFIMFGPLERIAGALGADDPAVAGAWARLILHFAIGLGAIMFGFFLLAPAFVKIVEFAVAPVVAIVLRLDPRLLRQQLSAGLWRAAGTCAALMVGLAVLVVMQVQGNTALKGWKLPTKFPDIFIVSPPGLIQKTGVAFDESNVLDTIPGIKPGEVMPIAIASPQFGHGALALINVAANPDATMFFGIDPLKGFKLMELEFRDGTVENAQRMLAGGRQITLDDGTVLHGTFDGIPVVAPTTGPATGPASGPSSIGMAELAVVPGDNVTIRGMKGETTTIAKSRIRTADRGRYLIVTNEFKVLKNLGVGDDFELKRSDRKVVPYKIVGVVWSPGIDVIVSVFDMGRQFDQRTAASVFGTLYDAKEDFGIERLYLFAANLEWDVQRVDLMKQIKSRLKQEGMRAGDVRGIKERITTGLQRLIDLASFVAYAAMAVASLGVTNTVMAGVRTRRWQFGVLRSIGVTRSQLLRLVLSEAILLGIVACAMGLGAGAVLVLDAQELQKLNTGYNPPLAVPWGIVAIGSGIVMFIALAASLWPAITVSRAEPLTLLQAGRASA